MEAWLPAEPAQKRGDEGARQDTAQDQDEFKLRTVLHPSDRLLSL